MEFILDGVRKFSQRRNEEDFVDRLNFQITPLILLTASGLISYKAYFGNQALICWTPAQFTKAWNQYTSVYCLIENTYYVPLNNSIPSRIEARENAKLSYYQWVPFALTMQAFLFCAPHVFWRSVNWMSGVQVRAVVVMAKQAIIWSQNKINVQTIRMITNHLVYGLRIHHNKRIDRIFTNPFGFFINLFTRHATCYISCCYLIMKVLFVVNLLIQLAIFNFFLNVRGENPVAWGIQLFIHLCAGDRWKDTGMFPRVTMCDFEVRTMGNLHRWSVQCVLPLNMFNEKIYIALWFWVHFVLLATIANLVTWMINVLVEKRRTDFINDMLKVAQVTHPKAFGDTQYPRRPIMDKLFDTLSWDGILILRIIQANAGVLPCIEILTAVFSKIKFELDAKEKKNLPQEWRKASVEGRYIKTPLLKNSRTIVSDA